MHINRRPALILPTAAIAVILADVVYAQERPAEPDQAAPAAGQDQPRWQYGGFVDVGYLDSFNDPTNHLFRNRGTTPRVDEWDVNMADAFLKKAAS